MSSVNQSPTRIVLLGGGYTTIWAYRAMARRLRKQMRRGEVSVTLVSADNCHSFHGWTGEILGGIVDDSHRLTPLRDIFGSERLVHGRVSHIDVVNRTVSVQSADESCAPSHGETAIPYDKLVVGVGSSDNVERIAGMKMHGWSLKQKGGTVALRRHLVQLLEKASVTSNSVLRKKLLTVVVAGGGWTGVEMSAAIAEWFKSQESDYPVLREHPARVVLVHSKDALLSELRPSFNRLAEYATAQLQRYDNIILRLETRIEKVTEEGAYLDDTRFVNSATVVSSVGQRIEPMSGLESAPTDPQGRLITDEYLRVAGFEDVWTGGDVAHVQRAADQPACPSNAAWAMKHGNWIGRNIARDITGKPLRRLRGNSLGQAASMGVGKGAAELCGIQFTGRSAWLCRLLFFLALSPSRANAVRVLFDWLMVPVFGRRRVPPELIRSGNARITRAALTVSRDHPEVRTVVRGDHYYGSQGRGRKTIPARRDPEFIETGHKTTEQEMRGRRERTLGMRLTRRGLVRLGVASVLALVGIPLATSWHAMRRNTASTEISTSARALPVASGRIQQVSSYSQKRHFTGVTVAARASELAFERSDRLVRAFVDEGATVKKGDALAQLETAKLAARRQQVLAERAQAAAVLAEMRAGPRQETIDVAKAEVNRLRAELTLHKTQLERRKRLAVKRAITEDELEQFAFNFRATTARLDAANRQLDELEAGTRAEKLAAQEAEIKRLDAVLSEIVIEIRQSTIRAPFHGRIAVRFVDEGTLVTPNMPIVRLVESKNLEARIGLPPEFADILDAKSHYAIQVQGNSYRARFRALLPELNRRTRTRTAVFVFDDTAAATIVPAQIAGLTLSRTMSTNGFWLPSTALARAERGLWNVMALTPRDTDDDCCQTERRVVELLHTEGDQVLVRGTLLAGDLVVVDGVHRVVAGQLVRSVPSVESPEAAGAAMLTAAPPQGSSIAF